MVSSAAVEPAITRLAAASTGPVLRFASIVATRPASAATTDRSCLLQDSSRYGIPAGGIDLEPGPTHPSSCVSGGRQNWSIPARHTSGRSDATQRGALMIQASVSGVRTVNSKHSRLQTGDTPCDDSDSGSGLELHRFSGTAVIGAGADSGLCSGPCRSFMTSCAAALPGTLWSAIASVIDGPSGRGRIHEAAAVRCRDQRKRVEGR